MLSLHVEGKDIKELSEKAMAALQITIVPAVPKVHEPDSPPPPPVDEVAKKRGRPPKETPSPASSSAEAPAPAAPAAATSDAKASATSAAVSAAAVPSVEEVRAALHSVTVKIKGDETDAKGLERASQILVAILKLPAEQCRVSLVQEADRAKLIALCKETMKGTEPA